MADVEMRFFCHQCSRNIPRVAADYTCPTCNSGFIEELGQGAGAPVGQADNDHEEHQEQPQLQYDLGQVLGPLESILPGLLGGGLGPQREGVHLGPGSGTHGPMFTASRGPSNIRISARAGPGQQPGNLGMDQAALENALQDFVFNLAGMQFGAAPGGGGGGGGGARFQFIGPGQGAGFQLHGNPGDYAWGRGGLDTIITQLLNQMDGAGPPPMASDTISAIPTVTIDKKVLEKNANCSVCFEDFSVGDQARLLECGHCFHTDCIVPWLELHGTCPVCRKVLDPNGARPPEQRETDQTQPSDNTNSSSSSTNASTSTSSSVPPTVTTPTGGGGLSGMIQSAISQVFRGSNWAPTSQPQSEAAGSAPRSSTRNPPQTPAHTESRDNNGANRSDDDTPVARRQRLDSDFVDFDFD